MPSRHDLGMSPLAGTPVDKIAAEAAVVTVVGGLVVVVVVVVVEKVSSELGVTNISLPSSPGLNTRGSLLITSLGVGLSFSRESTITGKGVVVGGLGRKVCLVVSTVSNLVEAAVVVELTVEAVEAVGMAVSKSTSDTFFTRTREGCETFFGPVKISENDFGVTFMVVTLTLRLGCVSQLISLLPKLTTSPVLGSVEDLLLIEGGGLTEKIKYSRLIK